MRTNTTEGTADWSWLRRYPFEDVAAAFTAALGDVVWDTRKARGYSRKQLAPKLARKCVVATLLSYEHATRHMGAERLLDLCIVLEVSMPGLINDALLRARHTLENVPRTAPPMDEDTAPAADEIPDETADVDEVDEAVAGLRLAAQTKTEAEQVTARQLARGHRAIAQNQALRELNQTLRNRIHGLQLEVTRERERAEANEGRGEAAEERADKAGQAVAELNAKHAKEIADLTAGFERELRDARLEARREAPVSDRPPVAFPDLEPFVRWQDAAQALEIVDGADDFHVRVYNMLTPLQKLTLRALACGTSSATVANSQNVSPPQLDKHLRFMVRRFRAGNEWELKALAKKMFGTEKGDDDN